MRSPRFSSPEQCALDFDVPGLVAGVDEVGRGPLAGPVVAAAVILDPARRIRGLADSKTLGAARREALAEEIRAKALCVAIGSATVEEIDAFNILQATLLAMRRAVDALRLKPVKVLVDGNQLPVLAVRAECVVGGDARVKAISAASIVAKVHRDALCLQLDALRLRPVKVLVDGNQLPVLQVRAECIIGGDARVKAISAASIIAKVHRDRLCLQLDALHPQYGFAQHKGYASPEHLAALRRHGASPVHRRSFAPVREALQREARAGSDGA